MYNLPRAVRGPESRLRGDIQRGPVRGFLLVLLPRVKLLLDISTGWPAHQMHSCLLLILITWKLENAILHLEQEGLSCFGRRG